jgi:hypothetical protein
MTLPSMSTKGMTLKDWIWIIGSGAAVVGSWAVLGNDVTTLKEAREAQVTRDNRQDDQMRDNRNEVIGAINRNADEIKEEIRGLRREIHKAK